MFQVIGTRTLACSVTSALCTGSSVFSEVAKEVEFFVVNPVATPSSSPKVFSVAFASRHWHIHCWMGVSVQFERSRVASQNLPAKCLRRNASTLTYLVDEVGALNDADGIGHHCSHQLIREEGHMDGTFERRQLVLAASAEEYSTCGLSGNFLMTWTRITFRR